MEILSPKPQTLKGLGRFRVSGLGFRAYEIQGRGLRVYL